MAQLEGSNPLPSVQQTVEAVLVGQAVPRATWLEQRVQPRDIAQRQRNVAPWVASHLEHSGLERVAVLLGAVLNTQLCVEGVGQGCSWREMSGRRGVRVFRKSEV